MRKPFRAISPLRTGDDPVAPVRGADLGSAVRTVDAPDRPGTGASPNRTPIASGIGGKRTGMLGTALALLLATSPVAAAPPPVPSTLPDLEAAQVAAEAAVRSGDYRSAAARYRDVLADLESRRAVDAPEAEWTRTLLKLAVVESTLGHAEASRTAMERVLALDPAFRLDPELFSPAFRREFEAARVRVALRPRFRLLVTTRDGSGQGVRAGAAARPGAGGGPASGRKLPRGRAGRERGANPHGGSRARRDRDRGRRRSTSPLGRSTCPEGFSCAGRRRASPADGWMRPTAWATTGLAVAAAGIATWQGIAAAGSYADATGMLQPDGSLRPGVDPAAYAAAASAYQSERRNAWIAGGSALVLGVGATVLWLLVPSSAVEPAPGGLAVRF